MGSGGGGEEGEGGGAGEEKAMNSLDSLKHKCKNLSDRHHLLNMKICPEKTSRRKKRYLPKSSLPHHSILIYRIGTTSPDKIKYRISVTNDVSHPLIS